MKQSKRNQALMEAKAARKGTRPPAVSKYARKTGKGTPESEQPGKASGVQVTRGQA